MQYDLVKLLEFGLGSTVTIMVVLIAGKYLWVLGNYFIKNSIQYKDDFVHALNESRELMRKTVDESKEREESTKVLLKSALNHNDELSKIIKESTKANADIKETINMQHETINRQQETIDRQQVAIDASIKTIETLSRSHSIMLSNLGDELKEIKDVQVEIIDAIKKNGE